MVTDIRGSNADLVFVSNKLHVTNSDITQYASKRLRECLLNQSNRADKPENTEI